MAEDLFIDEISEELKREKLYGLWRKYGIYAIASALFLLLMVVLYQLYQYSQDKKTARLGDSMLTALSMAESGKAEALAKLTEIEKSAKNPSYVYLARFRKAALLQNQHKSPEANKIYDELINDNKAPSWFRDVARIKKAYALIDKGDNQSLKTLLSPCLEKGNHFSSMAREVLGLSAMRYNKPEEAQKYFKQIVDDKTASRDLARRAAMMLWLIEVEKSHKS